MSAEELRLFVQPEETLFEVAQRTRFEPIVSGVAVVGNLRGAQVLEISGPSGSTKTSVLTQVQLEAVMQQGAEIAAEQILPAEVAGCRVSAHAAENVVVLDLDAKFDVGALCEALERRLPAEAMTPDPAMQGEVPAVLGDCLDRCHVVQCHNSQGYLDSLELIRTKCQHLQDEGGLRVLLIDNVASNYWIDRSVRVPAGQPAEGMLTLQAVHSAAAATLSQIVRDFRLAVVATSHTPLRPQEQEGSTRPAQHVETDPHSGFWTKRDFLPRVWQDLITHQVAIRLLANGTAHAKWLKPPSDRLWLL